MKAWTSAMFSGFTDTSETLYALETLRSSENRLVFLLEHYNHIVKQCHINKHTENNKVTFPNFNFAKPRNTNNCVLRTQLNCITDIVTPWGDVHPYTQYHKNIRYRYKATE